MTDSSPSVPPSSPGAVIASVAANSPADRAGLVPGMSISHADDQLLRDIIDWLWISDGLEIGLTLISSNGDGTLREVLLSRELGEPWGIEFAQPIFDSLMTCNNDCEFCFIEMLPAGLRPSLYQRDDDYRLSFLQGSFVTLTNIDASQAERIIEQRLSPLHVSLHAVDPDVRRQLMGENAQHGLVVFAGLLAAGIEAHCQIVLVPGLNDGPVLQETLDWALGQPGILSLGVVPFAYTQYAARQTIYSASQATQLIDELLPLAPRIQLADEWFILAGRQVPNAAYYGEFPQFENGIGLVRSCIDDWQQAAARLASEAGEESGLPANERPAALVITGTAFAPILTSLINQTPAASHLQVLAVPNRFFGGSVNVAGLLTATDIIAAWQQLTEPAQQATGPAQPATPAQPAQPATQPQPQQPVFIPSIIFNDDGLTLDGFTAEQLAASLGRPLHVVSYLTELLGILT
ncbi:MAG: DUF512 domain-containing protein [Coriobacteriia bacterium]|nr:DUF512 domain-containing protein [Coriobacteriia bacterium]